MALGVRGWLWLAARRHFPKQRRLRQWIWRVWWRP